MSESETGPTVKEQRIDDADGPLVDYLRVSITDRCNLRCVYCMPAEGVESLCHEEVLRYEEMELFARAAVRCGISKIRITGGEPLVRRGVVDFVGMLAEIEPGLGISMTTNGLLLARYARGLAGAGLHRVNVSIDSLDPEVYRRITRVGDLSSALAGLESAVDAGLEPVKLNVVTLKGVNEDVSAFADLTRRMPVHVRFIEYMPYFDQPGKWFVPSEATRRRLERLGTLQEAEPPEGWGPAGTCGYYRLKGAQGTLGFISPVSGHFCKTCNRLRITAEGRMRTCLFDPVGFDVRSEIRAGAGVERLSELIRAQLDRKRAEGDHKPRRGTRVRAQDHMSRIGG